MKSEPVELLYPAKLGSVSQVLWLEKTFKVTTSNLEVSVIAPRECELVS